MINTDIEEYLFKLIPQRAVKIALIIIKAKSPPLYD